MYGIQEFTKRVKEDNRQLSLQQEVEDSPKSPSPVPEASIANQVIESLTFPTQKYLQNVGN